MIKFENCCHDTDFRQHNLNILWSEQIIYSHSLSSNSSFNLGFRIDIFLIIGKSFMIPICEILGKSLK